MFISMASDQRLKEGLLEKPPAAKPPPTREEDMVKILLMVQKSGQPVEVGSLSPYL